MGFIFKMAWRDSRRNRSRLLLFISVIISGIAALTAIRSFSDNLRSDIDRESKTLLGADLQVGSNNGPAPDSLLALIDTAGVEKARILNMLSMVRFTSNGGTRLALVRAIEGGFPYYGKWKTEPEASYKTFRTAKKALVDHALMLQFNIKPGDSIQIGTQIFAIEGDLLSSPGRAGIASAVAPVVFIPMQWIDSTGLVQPGSRIDYQYYYKFPAGINVDARVKPYEKQFDKAHLDLDTVDGRKESIGKAFGNFGAFLNLVGFIALLLGCIGVAGAVHQYVKDKLPTVAILRCLGASGKKAFLVYLVQVAGIGLIGALAGALLGTLIQLTLPSIMKDFLPIDDVSTAVSIPAVIQGTLLGVIVSVLFALQPLSGILRTSPLRAIRSAYGEQEQVNRPMKWGIYALLAVSIFGFAWWLIHGLRETVFFVLGITAAFLLLYGLARLLMFLLKRFFPRKWSFVWRQSIANLFRPENQTVLMVVTIGLGSMLLSTLFLVQNMLLRQVEFSGSGNQPNIILFDIQPDQKAGVTQMVRESAMPLMQEVPIIGTRIESINGRTKAQDEVDTTKSLRPWVWDREYRVTFRDTLIDSEEIVEGSWIGQAEPGKPIPVSISEQQKRWMKVEVGDKVVFNVQGARLETEVASVRKVDFTKLQTNFHVLFPKGVLENAPQFHVIVSKVNNAEQSAQFQSKLVQKYPNVSAIDLTQILKSVDEILRKISFVIRFMAFFSILTGLLVLIGSIYQGKYVRMRESVLLRTLGASGSQILRINALEYFLLGALACLAGLILSLGGAWALAEFVFKIPFRPDFIPVGFTFVAITALSVIIGMITNREVLSKPPLEVLRSEVN